MTGSSAPGRRLAVNPVTHQGGAETVLLALLRGRASRGWRISATTPDGGLLADLVAAAGLGWAPVASGGLRRRRGAGALFGWGQLRRLARDLVERAPPLWRLADLILADSEAVAGRLRDLDTALDPLVVGVGVDLDPPVADVPWREGSGPVVGFVGRLEPRKGDPYASAPGYTAAGLSRAATMGVEPVPWHDNAPGLMRHLDVLVLPSVAEPFGTVLAEAMAVGTPVVATSVVGLLEVVQDGVSGRLVPPGDPAALAAAMLEVLRDRSAVSAAVRERAVRWSAPAYVERIDALLSAQTAVSR